MQFRNVGNMFLLFVMQFKGWDGLYRIEETNLVCAISRKLVLGWKIELFGIRPKMDPKWS